MENRLTTVELGLDHQDEWNEATSARLAGHDRRLNLHEKAILALGALLQIVMQDKYPWVAELLRGLLKGLMP